MKHTQEARNPLAKVWSGVRKLFAGEAATAVDSEAGWTTWGTTPYRRQPGTNTNYERLAGDLSMNPVCAACIQWIARTLPEAPPILQRTRDDETAEVLKRHDVLALLDTPNPYHSGDQLMAAIVSDGLVHGNAYLRKVRNGAGKPVQLWYIPWRQVRVIGGSTSDTFVDHYEYWANGETEHIDPAEIINIPIGIPDPLTMGRTYLSPWAAFQRAVAALNSGETYTASVLRNRGTPGLYVAPDAGQALTPDQARELKAYLTEATTGDNAGKPIVGFSASTLSAFGFSPEQLALDTILDRPEAGLCAAIGISPMVIGLKVGLEHSTYSNMSEAQEAAYEKCVIPTKTTIGRAFTSQLLPDFEEPKKGWRVAFDYSKVAALQDDQNEKTKRLVAATGGPYLTVNEARTLDGLPEDAAPESSTIRAAKATPATTPDAPALPAGAPNTNAAGVTRLGYRDDVLNSFLAGWQTREGGQ